MDLFDSAAAHPSGVPAYDSRAPLAVRMRPPTIEDVVGQDHLLAPGSPLMRLVVPPADGDLPPSSVIMWGPAGTGKTTLAYVVARASGREFRELSAVTAGVKDVREVIETARRKLTLGRGETVLFIDEVHRFSKAQQDALLPAVENRWVTLVAATTENPSFSVISPLLSRSILVTLKALDDESVRELVRRALDDDRGLGGRLAIESDALTYLVRLAGGDGRKSLTILEAAAGTALSTNSTAINLEHVEQAIDVAAVRYDRAGDQHYDVTSAFIKSMRGSDVDAALHYLARMIVAGEDPRFIARRIVIAAAEEVGMADPTALQVAVAAAEAVAFLGMPEGRIPLAQAVIHVAAAPKSNAAYMAIDKAIADVNAGKMGEVPAHLRDAHYAGAKKLGHGIGYEYAHDAPHAVGRQEYLPATLREAAYYVPTDRGFERAIGERLTKMAHLRGRNVSESTRNATQSRGGAGDHAE